MKLLFSIAKYLQLITIVVLLFSTSHAQVNCAADKAAFENLKKQLSDTRTAIKKNQDDLDYISRQISHATVEKGKLIAYYETITDKKSLKAKAVSKAIDQYATTITTFKEREKQVKKDLAYFKKEEPIILNSYHLVQDRLIQHCSTESQTNTESKPTAKTVHTPIPKPSAIELSETTKYGTFTITMNNTKDNIFEGVYNNNQKAVFQLNEGYKDGVFSLSRLSLRSVSSYANYSGSINGNNVSGTIVSGGGGGTFTARLK